MRKLFKRAASLVLIPLTRWYLRKERKFQYKNVTVFVHPGTFHPGLFYSTVFLADYLLQQDIKNKTFLELGCGSGLISILVSKAGGEVTASDLSQKAISNTKRNADHNHVNITVVHSDLFDNLKGKKYDWIVINPPYYAKPIGDDETLAWHCGENFEYFENFFYQLPEHLSTSTQVVMVLTQGCDLERIFKIAAENGFRFILIKEKKVLFDEKDLLYRIEKI